LDHERSPVTPHDLPHGPGGDPFDTAPFLVIWEVTRACELACAHCRAAAIPHAHPDELTTAEGKALIDEIRRFGRPLLVLTGGDPLARPDIFELVSHARNAGMRPGLSPAGTPRLTQDAVLRMRDHGVGIVSLSIDAPTAALHDAFRGVPGSFGYTVAGARYVTKTGLPLQVNTVITDEHIEHIDRLAALVAHLGAARWEVFFLVPTGRGADLRPPSPSRAEEALHRLAEIGDGAPFHLTVVEAPFYRRVVLERQAAREGRQPLEVLAERRSGGGRFLPGINAGKGFAFVSHTGKISPSGFLPLVAGDVRRDSLVDVYRQSALFRTLREPDRLGGKCGICPYRAVCGGSRARAFAMTGDPLAADPCCDYFPIPAAAA
jgi:radical SAM protein